MDSLSLTLIPISLFMMIGIVLCSLAWLFYKSRQDHHETIRKALELGQPLDPHVLRIFAQSQREPEDDLRAGIISICVGLAFMVVTGVNIETGGDHYGSQITGFIGILTVGFGVGRLLASRIAKKPKDRAKALSSDK
jgi:hypothetical protein